MLKMILTKPMLLSRSASGFTKNYFNPEKNEILANKVKKLRDEIEKIPEDERRSVFHETGPIEAQKKSSNATPEEIKKSNELIGLIEETLKESAKYGPSY